MSVTHHGIKLAANSAIENFVVETLAADPVVTQAGRAWFNSTEKEWKFSQIDDLGALEIVTLSSEAELQAVMDAFRAELASQEVGPYGTALIGFNGFNGTNGNVTIGSMSLQGALQQLVIALDGDIQDLSDYVTSNDAALADEASTRAANDGDLATLTTTAKDSLVSALNEVKAAMEFADATLDAKIDSSVAGLVDGAPALLDTLNELAAAINDDENFSTTVATDIANAKAELKGAATAAMDTMEEIEAVIGDWTTKSVDITSTTVTGALNELQAEVIAASSAQTDAVDAVQLELDATQTGAGLGEDGAYTATGTANYIALAASLDDADQKLDAALKAEETARIAADNTNADAIADEETARITAVSNESSLRDDADIAIQAELDSTQTGAGLAVSGAYVATVAADYIGTAVSLDDADQKLAAALKVEETARIDEDAALDSRITTVEDQVNGNIGDLTTLTTDAKDNLVNSVNEVDANANLTQAELDVTQTGAGLGTDGTYTATGTANYIATAVSLDDADQKLDAALKAEETARETLQNEVNATQTGAGLGEDGTYTATGTANYIATAADLDDADQKLDTALKAEETARLASDATQDTRLDDIENALGDGTIGDLATLTTDEQGTIVGAINEVDLHTDSVQAELDVSQIGAGLATNGAYVVPVGTSYLDTSISLADADAKLDAALNVEKLRIDQEIIDRTNEDALKLDLTGGVLTGILNLSDNSIINVGTPVGDKDAVNKVYVDNLSAGVQYKSAVRATTTEAITLSGVQTVDGVALAEGDRVLVKDQADALANGVYDVGVGAWTRSTDFDDDIDTEVTKGAAVLVLEGTINSKIGYVLLGSDTDGTAEIQVGSDPLVFSQFSGAATVIAGAGIAKDGNELSINMGAGIIELPTDEIGIDLSVSGGLFMTEDGTTSSEGTDAKLAIQIADASLTNTATGIKISDPFITTFYDEIGAINNELTVTQTGAGLGEDGTYTATGTANYIALAVSLDDADQKLDAALKAEETARLASDATQDARLDDIENALGDGTIGDLATLTTDEKGTIVGAINEVDLHTDSVQAELDTTQIGAGLSTTGTYSADATADYIAGATSLFNADQLLDDSLKAEEDARIAADAAIQSEVDANTAAIGGEYTEKSASNFLVGTTNLDDGVEALDAALQSHVDAQAAVTVDTSGAETVGYDGATGANGLFSTTAGTVADTLDSVTSELDAVKQTAVDTKAAINATRYTVDSESALSHTITHNLGSQFVDVKVWILDGATYKNAVVGEEITDTNTVTITLTQAYPVRIIVESMDQIA